MFDEMTESELYCNCSSAHVFDLIDISTNAV